MKPCILSALVVVVTMMPTATVVGQDIAPAQVRESIDKGVRYLLQDQQPNGGWSEFTNQPGGLTALCTLALLYAGVPADDPHMRAALNYLRKADLSTTYAISLQTMVFCRATPSEDLMQIRRNVKWLEDHQVMDRRRGSWSYPQAGGDNSNAQFALLALYEAEQAGVPVRLQTWRLAKAYWEDCQNLDGSWGYLKGLPGTGSMTAAGVTALVICDDRVGGASAQVAGEKIQCCGRAADADGNRVDRALAWLGRNFSITGNPGIDHELIGRTRIWHYYYLYGLERVGRMTSHRFIGRHDWYREGVNYLIAHGQDQLSGFFRGEGHAEEDPHISTSFALIFLSKGRWPTLMAKLRTSNSDDWNRHRGDVGNLTRYVERRWKQDLTWQILDTRSATVDDLLQAPVLYLCGSESPLPANPVDQDALAQKLREYLERGGFLFAEAYCGNEGFDRGFRALLEKIFPEPEYRLRLLPLDHPIWFAEEGVKRGLMRPLWGIDFGCRTSVVYAPRDPPENPRPALSCLWDLGRPARGMTYAPAVQEQIDSAMSLGLNILVYATNREVLKKEEVVFATPQGRTLVDKLDRGRVELATLRHPGGCNVAPRAVINLLDAARKETRLRAGNESPLLAITDEALFNYPMVFMHGRNAFHLTDNERQALRTYLQRGGLLFADAVCASTAFVDSFRREINGLVPGKTLEPIAAKDPLWTRRYGGFDLPSVRRREPAIRSATDPLKAIVREGPPMLEGIKQDGRYAVIFSPLDLSCALEKQDSLECRGYLRDDATKIGINVLLYGLQE